MTDVHFHKSVTFVRICLQADKFPLQGSGHELYGGFPGYGSMLLSGQAMEQVPVSLTLIMMYSCLKLFLIFFTNYVSGDACHGLGSKLHGSPWTDRVPRSSRPPWWSSWTWRRWRRWTSADLNPTTILPELLPHKLHAAGEVC